VWTRAKGQKKGITRGKGENIRKGKGGGCLLQNVQYATWRGKGKKREEVIIRNPRGHLLTNRGENGVPQGRKPKKEVLLSIWKGLGRAIRQGTLLGKRTERVQWRGALVHDDTFLADLSTKWEKRKKHSGGGI